MKKVFPLSFFGKNLKSVILSALLYSLIFVATSIVVGSINGGEKITIALNLLRQFVMLYTASGIVVAVLNAVNLLDRKWFE